MEVKEIYERFSGDYEDVLSRMMNDKRIIKYITKYLDDDDFDNFNKAIEEKNYEDAFRFSHNMKGVSLNLGFTKLAKSASTLCEFFRHGDPTEDFSAVHEQVRKDREEVLSAIKLLG